jgi:hypothetical protein
MAPASRSYQLSATPFAIFAQLLAIAVTILVLVLFLHFRDGFAFRSDNKQKIFNVCVHMYYVYVVGPLIPVSCLIFFLFPSSLYAVAPFSNGDWAYFNWRRR